MDNKDLANLIACSRLKSARRRKRLQKWHHDKWLRRLDARHQDLRAQHSALPLVPLEKPYQKGWKRFFVLRQDIGVSREADFYERLLSKINTVIYAADRKYMTSRRKRGKRYKVPMQQFVRSYWSWEWYDRNVCRLTEQERALFHPEECIRKDGRRTVRYVFNEPWRFVLKVEPHMITHQRLFSQELEQQIAGIQRLVKSRHLGPHIEKLTRHFYSYDWDWEDQHIDADRLRNQPLHKLLADVEAELI